MDRNSSGSFANLIQELQHEKSPLTALDVVLKVVEVFLSFRDITTYGVRRVSHMISPLHSSHFNASTFSVLPQRGSNLGSRNIDRILSLSVTSQPNTPPHIPRRRHPPIDYVRRLPRPTNPAIPQSPYVPAFSPHPPRIRTSLRARVQGGSEHPGCKHRCSRMSPR